MSQPHGGYERSDAHAGATYRAGFAILAAMVLTAIALVPMYRWLARQESQAQPPRAEVARTEMSEPALHFPRLVSSEPGVLAAFRAREQALLTSYGWVEKDKGIVRIPIDEAMRIVAEHGLPNWEAPAAPAAAKPAGPGGRR